MTNDKTIPPIPSSCVYNYYQEDMVKVSHSGILSKSSFSHCVKTCFPKLVGRCAYHSAKKSVWVYVGFTRRQHLPTDLLFINSAVNQKSQQIGANYGYSIMPSSSSELKLMKYAPLLRDNTNVVKDITITSTHVDVTFGGKNVNSCLSSNSISDLKELDTLLQYVDRVKVCPGVIHDDSVSDTHFITRPFANATSPLKCQMRSWSKTCIGYLPLGSLKKQCDECRKAIKMCTHIKPTSTTVPSIYMEHSYSNYAHASTLSEDVPGPSQDVLGDKTEDTVPKPSPDVMDDETEETYSDSDGSITDNITEDPTYTPTDHSKKKPVNQAPKLDTVLSAIKEVSPSLINEQFTALLNSQLVNSEKEGTQVRWDPW